MKINYKNFKKTFKKYYKYFLNYINPLYLNNRYKIKLLKYNIFKRLTTYTLDLVILININFNNFYNNLKATNINF